MLMIPVPVFFGVFVSVVALLVAAGLIGYMAGYLKGVDHARHAEAYPEGKP